MADAVSEAMIETKAIILFYQDEFNNLDWIAACDARGDRATGDRLGREIDRWENHPEHVKDRFRTRARAALGIAPDLEMAEACEACGDRLPAKDAIWTDDGSAFHSQCHPDPRPPGAVKALEDLAQRIDADGTASQIGSAEEIREILAALAAPSRGLQKQLDDLRASFPITEGEPSDAELAYFDGLVERAKASAVKAAANFPQPNYVALKIAKEAGEVVRGAVHYAENRMEWQEVEGEIVQLLAMLIRFVTEGDQINGITPPAHLNGGGSDA